MYFSKAILLIIICLFINACNEKASTVSLNNPPTYNGNQRQARLSVDNQAILVRALFEGVQAMTAPTLLSHHLEKAANDNVILTNINLERNCKISGKIKLTGTLDTNNRSGDLTLNGCIPILQSSRLKQWADGLLPPPTFQCHPHINHGFGSLSFPVLATAFHACL